MYQGRFLKDSNPASTPRKAASSAKPAKKRGIRVSSLVFYTVFFLFVFLFYGATYFGLLELRDWLSRYELAQPDQKSREVFQEMFLEANWGDLYDAAGVQDTLYESREVFIRHMETVVSGGSLRYMETSAGLSGGKKYVVRLGESKIATFTLEDRRTSHDPQSLPDWQLGQIDLHIDRKEGVRIQKASHHTAYVNGIPLDDSHTIQTSTSAAAEYLPAGVTSETTCVQELTGLIAAPTVTVLDAQGQEMPLRYEEASDTYVEQMTAPAIEEQERELALQALKTYARYMMKEAGRSDLTKYYKKSSDAYRSITATERGYVQDAAGYEFVNERVTDYCRYSDRVFSVRVSVTLNQNRANGSIKESTIDQSMFFEQQDSGKWLCYAMTAIDISQPVVKVRITFMNGEQVIESDFYETSTNQIVCPMVTAPEGKVFSGWVVEEMDEHGKTTKTLVFQPDGNGVAHLPAGGSLSAMRVFPLFEEA